MTKPEIEKIFKQARRYLRHSGLDILLHPAAGPASLLVITPKAIGNSPERNKVRRRLKAIFYEANLNASGFDCIIIIKKPGINLSYDFLKELLQKAYKNANS